jgi:hypothetical protein
VDKSGPSLPLEFFEPAVRQVMASLKVARRTAKPLFNETGVLTRT